MTQFFVTPKTNVSGGFLASLSGVTLTVDPYNLIAANTYTAFSAATISDPFMPTGVNAVPGPSVITGAEPAQFIIAPEANFNGAGDLASLTGCFLSTSTALTGLLSNVSYRAIELTGPSPDIVVSAATGVTQYTYPSGHTVFFSRPIVVVMTPDDAPMFVADTNVDFWWDEPTYQDINGRWRSGMMQDPLLSNSTQGYDQVMSVFAPSTEGVGTGRPPYTHALNIDPGAGGRFTVAGGSTTCFVKTFGVPTVGTAIPGQPIDVREELFFIPTQWPVGSFAPSIPGPIKLTGFNESQVTYNVLRSLPLEPSVLSLAAAAGTLPRSRPMYEALSADGENMRRVYNDGEYSYSGDFFRYMREGIPLHSDATNAEKRAIYMKWIARGIHCLGSAANGQYNNTGTVGAGEDHWGEVFPWMAAFALQDQAMIDLCKLMRSNLKNQEYIVKDFMIGIPMRNPDNPGDANEQAFIQAHYPETVGQPQHMESYEPGQGDFLDTSWNSRYRSVSNTAQMYEMILFMMLQNGPGGVDAIDMLNATGFIGALDYTDASAAYMKGNGTSRGTAAEYIAQYEAWRDLLISKRARWQGVIRLANSGAFTASATAGGIDWAHNSPQSYPATTRRDQRYSMDEGRTWLEVIGIGTGGTRTGLTPGQKYYCQRRNFNGATGRWSLSPPNDKSAGTINNAVTPTGTVANAQPVNVMLPAFTYYELPWMGAGHGFKTCTTPLDPAIGRLFLGMGFWSGFPIPTYTWRVKEGGTTLKSGTWTPAVLTNSTITPEHDYVSVHLDGLAGKTVTLEVTANNGGADVVATSAALVIPLGRPNTGHYVPKGVAGAAPEQMTRLTATDNANWKVAAANQDIVYARVDRIRCSGSTNTTALPRILTLDSMDEMGALATVSEGEAVMLTSGGTSAAVNSCGFAIRCSSAVDAAFTGYFVEAIYNTTTTRLLRVSKYVAGSATAYTSADIGAVDRANYSVLRVNWRLVSGEMNFRAKLYTHPTEAGTPFPDFVEPDWQFTQTVPGTPLATGKMGVGYIQTNRNRDIHGFGLSKDPTVSAPLRPMVP